MINWSLTLYHKEIHSITTAFKSRDGQAVTVCTMDLCLTWKAYGGVTRPYRNALLVRHVMSHTTLNASLKTVEFIEQPQERFMKCVVLSSLKCSSQWLPALGRIL